MKVWCVIENADGMLNASVHLTVGGALVEAISDVLDFLQIDSQEKVDSLFKEWEVKVDELSCTEWRNEKIKEMKPTELWCLWDFWGEFIWDEDFDISVTSSQVKA